MNTKKELNNLLLKEMIMRVVKVEKDNYINKDKTDVRMAEDHTNMIVRLVNENEN